MKALLFILAFASTLVTLDVLFEEKLIYFPSRELEHSPDRLEMKYDELELHPADGERLHAWFLPARPGDGNDRFTVLMCHGNAGNISGRLDRALAMHANLGTDLLLFDYRGFGRSSGSPSEAGTYEDARAAYRYLVDERTLDPRKIVLLGESLGAAVALQLALEADVSGLVLEAPFTSIADMARLAYPFVPAAWVRTRYDNLAKIPSLSVPLLVVHGTRDPTVPYSQGERLFEAAPEPKRFLSIEGGGHADSYVVGGEAYWNAWKEFLSSLDDRPEAGA